MSRKAEIPGISEKFLPYIKNLSFEALRTDRIPFAGREKEIESSMETLLRRLKNKLLLVGKPGTGKTALITEIAGRTSSINAPEPIRNKIVIEFMLRKFMFSMSEKGTMLSEFESFFGEILQKRSEVILFIDDMPVPEQNDSSLSGQLQQIMNQLRFYVADRRLRLILSTTPENYYRHIKNDEMFGMNVSPVFINEPDKLDMLDMLEGVKPFFENYYKIKIDASIFNVLYSLAINFIPHRAFPHKGIDLFDMAASRASVKSEAELKLDYLYDCAADIAKLPVDIVRKNNEDLLEGVKDYLNKVVVNQKEAINEIARIIKIGRMDKQNRGQQPEGVFLFLGPAGVGKSFISARIAEYLFGSSDKLRIIDLENYKRPEDADRLLGSAEKRGDLVREVENNPFSVILFENIEEASSAVLYKLGKVFTRGELCDNCGKKYPVANIIFILSLTSIGEERMENRIGFVKGKDPEKELVIPGKIMNLLECVDEIVEFAPLTEKDLKSITVEKIDELRNEFMERYAVNLDVEDGIVKQISEASYESGEFAHQVGEIVERELRPILLEGLGPDEKGKTFTLGIKNDSLVLLPGTGN